MAKGFNEKSRPYRHKNRLGGGPKHGMKRAVNVSVDSDILAAAKQQGINLSQTLEDELRKLTNEARARKWAEENREAIESYNRFIAKHGIWSEKYRKW